MLSNGKTRVGLGLMSLLLAGAMCLPFSAQAADLPALPAATPRPTYNPERPDVLQNLFLYAEAGVLIDQDTGKVLYNMKGSKRMHPASTTKIMTLLLALENGDLDDEITVGDAMKNIPGDSSRVPLMAGETVTLRDLLYGLMIKSGNDAAMEIAAHVAGSVDDFVEMMNARADEIGCSNTHFTNPHGYEDKQHYTTASDLAKIARECMQNEDFREIVGTPTYTISANNKRQNDLVLKTSNQFVGRESHMEHQYEYGTGMKTGYFSNAKHTFVASASKNDINLIAVVLKTTKVGKWQDAKRLMEYGFATQEDQVVLSIE